MPVQSFVLRVLGLFVAAAALSFSAAASADPPSRVARLGYASGGVIFSAAGEDEWSQAALNRPLTIGDRLWVEDGARAELQDGGAVIRLHGGTGISVLNLDEGSTLLQLTQGSLNLRVRRLAPNQVVEVDTPQLALTLRQRGDYRIAVDPDGNVTDVIVRSGQAEVSGPGAAYIIDAQQRYRFRGNDLRDNEFLAAPRPDEFDRWASERDRAFDNSASARYVSPDVIGYQDLDANGVWRVDATYGNVWYPNQVGSDWAPYRDGHWTWIAPWGWTWVDDAPWGFAVSHYGRWANLGSRWAWVPGPVRTSAYYAPALVAFVGGDNFRLTIASGNVGGIGWFPLAPREVYRPSYVASRRYFENINRSNTVISTTVINNSYNTRDRDDRDYANRRIPGAVIAVPRNTFINSQHVSGAAVRMAPEMLGRAPLVAAPQVAPDERRRGAAAPAASLPPPRAFERPAVTRIAPQGHVPALRRDASPVMQPSVPTPVAAPVIEPRARPQGRDNGPQRAPVNVVPASSPPAQALPPPQGRPQPQFQPQPRIQPAPLGQPQAQPQVQPQPRVQPVPPVPPPAQPQVQPQPPQRPHPPESKAVVPQVATPQAAAPVPPARPPESRAPAAAPKGPVPAPAAVHAGPKDEQKDAKAPPAEGRSKEPEDGRDGPRRQEDRRRQAN